MFAAVYPPEDVREEVAAFLEARPGMRFVQAPPRTERPSVRT